MNTEISHLKIEKPANGCIRLENESVGDSYVVDVHPGQLRYMAEVSGLKSIPKSYRSINVCT
jgi:hypothetical protein